MITSAQCNLIANTYYDFTHLFTFDHDISSYTYKSEIRDITRTKVAEFQIISDADSVLLSLSITAINLLTTGEYYYDVKQISADGFKTQIIKGTFTVLDGITQ